MFFICISFISSRFRLNLSGMYGIVGRVMRVEKVFLMKGVRVFGFFSLFFVLLVIFV